MLKYALVTGASKGIGKCIAEELAAKGNNLVLVARSEGLLEEIAAKWIVKYRVQVKIIAIDLSEPNASQKIADWFKDNSMELEILVNNAGYGLWGSFTDLSLKEQLNMMQLNMNFMVELSHSLLPLLKKNPSSYILNVASTAAYQAIPTLTLYAATKSFVVLFSRGLSHELKGTGVSVTCLSPGGTKTGFVERSRMYHMEKTAEKLSMEPEKVARYAVKAMFAGKSEVIPGLPNKLGAFMTRLLPKSLVEKAASSIYKKK